MITIAFFEFVIRRFFLSILRATIALCESQPHLVTGSIHIVMMIIGQFVELSNKMLENFPCLILAFVFFSLFCRSVGSRKDFFSLDSFSFASSQSRIVSWVFRRSFNKF